MTTPKKHYWFPAKTHGWGWGFPVTWQGWAALLLFVVLVSLSTIFFNPAQNWPAFVIFNSLATAVFLSLCFLKGEPPKWRWGKKSENG